jgi:hypothetical protein
VSVIAAEAAAFGGQSEVHSTELGQLISNPFIQRDHGTGTDIQMLRQTDGEAISAIVDRIRTRFSGADDFNRLNYGAWLVHDVKPRISHDSLLLDA